MKAVLTPRILIVGTGESGKSLLAKSMAAHYEKSGLAVTVFDPIMTEWSADAFVTFDEPEFFEEIQKSYNEELTQAVFVDEADTLFSIGQKENFWLLTRGRHFKLYMHVITQRPALVAPTIRSQCNELYVFRVSKADAKLLAEDFAHEGVLEATELQQGEYLHVYWKDKKKALDKGKIF